MAIGLFICVIGLPFGLEKNAYGGRIIVVILAGVYRADEQQQEHRRHRHTYHHQD